MERESDLSVCPRCGQPNGCGIASPDGCWCAKEVSARLTPDPAVAACYCRRCLQSLLDEQAGKTT